MDRTSPATSASEERQPTLGTFAGTAGEVIKGILRPDTLVTAIPVASILMPSLILAGSLAWFFSRPGAITGTLLLAFVFSWLTGRFALAAREGNLTAGFLEGNSREATGFALRWLVASSTWSVPLAILTLALAGHFDDSGKFQPSDMILAPVGLMAALATLGPVFTLLAASTAHHSGDLFIADHWKCLLRERLGDVIVFAAAAIGGIGIYLLLYAIPFSALLALAYLIGGLPFLGLTAAPLCILPMALVPIYLGRLAGGFVYADVIAWTDLPGFAAEGKEAEIEQRNDEERLLPHRGTSSPEDLVAEATGTADAELAGSIVKWRQEADNGDLEAAFLLAHLYHRAGLVDHGIQVAEKLLPALLAQALPGHALRLYHTLSRQRHKLNLPSRAWDRIGVLLVSEGSYADGAWCLFHGARHQRITAQKRVIEVGRRAAAAGEHRQATTIFDAFLKRFPNSGFADFVRREREASAARIQD